jgi:hypothetical protein
MCKKLKKIEIWKRSHVSSYRDGGREKERVSLGEACFKKDIVQNETK